MNSRVGNFLLIFTAMILCWIGGAFVLYFLLHHPTEALAAALLVIALARQSIPFNSSVDALRHVRDSWAATMRDFTIPLSLTAGLVAAAVALFQHGLGRMLAMLMVIHLCDVTLGWTIRSHRQYLGRRRPATSRPVHRVIVGEIVDPFGPSTGTFRGDTAGLPRSEPASTEPPGQ